MQKHSHWRLISTIYHISYVEIGLEKQELCQPCINVDPWAVASSHKLCF